jgi:cupin fold WbuC family metalloprotein
MTIKQIDTTLLDDLTAKAVASPRKRAHHNLHPVLEDPVQRLCVAIEPGTYIRPHRHADPSTWEVFLLLRGSAVLLLFEEQGRVKERIVLAARGPVHAVEIPMNAWHSIASLETGSIFLEVKQGPYAAPKSANAASWAPAEGEPDAPRFEEWYRTARTRDLPPRPVAG